MARKRSTKPNSDLLKLEHRIRERLRYYNKKGGNLQHEINNLKSQLKNYKKMIKEYNKYERKTKTGIKKQEKELRNLLKRYDKLVNKRNKKFILNLQNEREMEKRARFSGKQGSININALYSNYKKADEILGNNNATNLYNRLFSRSSECMTYEEFTEYNGDSIANFRKELNKRVADGNLTQFERDLALTYLGF